MNTILLLHSIARYLVLIALIGVVIQSFMGLVQKRPYGNLENKSSLYLFIFTHTQLLLGLILYFISPHVVFSGESMKDSTSRYWLVEHALIMLMAITLITMARITSKKLSEDSAKYKRLLIFNGIALLLIILGISMSGRGFFGLPA